MSEETFLDGSRFPHALRQARSVRTLLFRAALLYLAWLVLVEARPGFYWLGIPVCLAVSLAVGAIGRASGRTISVPGLIAYIPGFLWRSLLGGVDVAGRVLKPSLPLRTGFTIHRFRENDEEMQVVFCDVLTLMPGSLVVDTDGKRALIHVLADESSTRRMITEEAARAARLYRADGPDTGTGEGGHP